MISAIFLLVPSEAGADFNTTLVENSEAIPNLQESSRRLLGDEVAIYGQDVKTPVFSSSRGMRRKLPIDGDVWELSLKWDNQIVHYDLTEVDLDTHKRMIIDSLKFLSYRLKGCIKFEEWDGTDPDTPRIKVKQKKDGGCKSDVGKVITKHSIKQYQDLNLEYNKGADVNCMNPGTIQHEFLHALGLVHTQVRTDRNDYIKYIRNNLRRGKGHNNFVIDGKSNHFGLPYDFASIMHYGADAFAEGRKKTIETNNRAYQNMIGQRDALSPQDVRLVELFYQCKAEEGSDVKYDPIRRGSDKWEESSYNLARLWKNNETGETQKKSEVPKSIECEKLDGKKSSCDSKKYCRWNADLEICDIPVQDCFKKNVKYINNDEASKVVIEAKSDDVAFTCKKYCDKEKSDREWDCAKFTFISGQKYECQCFKCENAEEKKVSEEQKNRYVSGQTNCESADNRGETKEQKCLYTITKNNGCMYGWLMEKKGCTGFCSKFNKSKLAGCFKYGVSVVDAEPHEKKYVKDPAECANLCKDDENCSHWMADFANSRPECQLYKKKTGKRAKIVDSIGELFNVAGKKGCVSEFTASKQTKRENEITQSSPAEKTIQPPTTKKTTQPPTTKKTTQPPTTKKTTQPPPTERKAVDCGDGHLGDTCWKCGIEENKRAPCKFGSESSDHGICAGGTQDMWQYKCVKTL